MSPTARFIFLKSRSHQRYEQNIHQARTKYMSDNITNYWSKKLGRPWLDVWEVHAMYENIALRMTSVEPQTLCTQGSRVKNRTRPGTPLHPTETGRGSLTSSRKRDATTSKFRRSGESLLFAGQTPRRKLQTWLGPAFETHSYSQMHSVTDVLQELGTVWRPIRVQSSCVAAILRDTCALVTAR